MKNIINKLKRYNKTKKTIHALQVLNDRELKDIGISRGDICYIASKRG